MLDWREVLSVEDEAALTGYSRPRGPFSGVAPTLLVVDVTEPFVGPDLPIPEAQKVSRQACGAAAWAALPHISTLLEVFRRRGWPVIFTAPDPNQGWVGGATRGRGDHSPVESGVVSAVRPEANEVVLVKTKASAFFGTALTSGLISSGSDSLVLAGGTTSGCVRATAVDGTSYGFEVLVAEEACFDRSQLSHAVSLRDIDAKYGRVQTTDEISKTLEGVGRGTSS